MSLYDRDYIRDTQPSSSFSGPKSVVGWLILINVIVFLADVFVFNGKLADWMKVERTTIIEPWQWWRFLTYGFAHASPTLRHILGNMIIVFFFGRQAEIDYGPKRFVAFYLTAIVLGGIGASVRAMLMGNQDFPGVIGASGAGFAIVVLFALRHPHATVNLMLLFPIPAWVFGLFYMVSEVFYAFNNPHSMIAHDVHLIGGVYGYLFYKTRWDLGQATPTGLKRLFSNATSNLFSGKRRVKIYDPDATDPKLDAEADRILAKLHREGESSLTAKERRTLETYSRRMKNRRRPR